MNYNNITVSVITITRNREHRLMKCVNSVLSQNYESGIEHIIIGDKSELLKSMESDILKLNPNTIIKHVDTEQYKSLFIQLYAPSRIGFLRNYGINLARGHFICHLDDDNTYDENHVSSLVQTMQSDQKVDIAYSWRKLVNQDGTPYTAEEYPWTPNARLVYNDHDLSSYIYNRLVAHGIRIPGDNTVRDTMIAPDGEPVYTVDTSELMVKKNVHDRYRFIVNFTWREMVGDYSDDYAFVKKCYEAGLMFASSQKATLTYTIGGISNRPKL